MTLSPVYIGRPQETREPVEQRVYDLLDALQISYQRVDHDPAYDMDACAGISQALGVHICKNLLLTPRNRSAFYLLAMPEDLPFRTADFSKIIGSSRLSFATGEDLQALLGVHPGSASVLGLMNDTEGKVQLLIDEDIMKDPYFGCHPCINTSSLKIRTSDLIAKIIPALKHAPKMVKLPGAEE